MSEQQKTEISHPLIWTAGLIGFGFFIGFWFNAMMGEGRMHGLQNPLQAGAAPAGPKGPDQMELIKALDDAALAKGKTVYDSTCLSCHGADGQLAAGGARKFGTEAFQNDKYGAGASPLSMNLTLEKGWNGGAMPKQDHLSIEDRFAVIHYIRETFMRGTDQYKPLDDTYLAELQAVAPSPAAAAEIIEPPDPTLSTKPLAIPVYAVLAETADQHKLTNDILWRAAQLDLGPGLQQAQVQLAALDGSKPGLAITKAVVVGDATAFGAALSDPLTLDSAPSFALLTAEEVGALYAGLRSIGKAKPSVSAH